MAVTFTNTIVSDPDGVQGNYPQELVVGHEGMLADLQAYVSRSYRNQTGACIPFGRLLQTDNDPTTNDVYAVELAAGADNIVGISIDSLTFEAVEKKNSHYTGIPTWLREDAEGESHVGYPDKQTLNVMSKGVIWVYTVEAVSLGDDVRAFIADYSATTSGADIGRFGSSAVASNTVLISGARWLSETTEAGIAMLELDIPASTFTADA
jgi:hypothetical protein